MKKVILSLTMVAFAVALQAGESKDCAKACADKAKATAATCDKATAKATCCAKQVKADATAKGATLLAKR